MYYLLEMPLHHIKTETIISASPKIVWEVLTDTHCWHKWGPSVTSVRCDDRFISAESKGFVRTITGLWVPFAITDYVPERLWAWRVWDIPATIHRVEALSAERCRIIFEVPLIAAPYLLVCKIAAKRIKRIAENNEEF